jgi:D-alanyl-D-alanine carboxypeptidase
MAGGWPNGNGDPMIKNISWTMTKLINNTLDDVPQTNAPGTNFAYSNFGYCILGRVIQKKTNISYASYVKNNILRPCGITKMDIGGNTLAFRKPDEVKYYGPGAPYSLNVTRMDAHGGWIASPIDLLRFINRVDRFSTIPDILSNASIDEMILPTALSTNSYAKGWMVNGHNYEHNGTLDGTISRMVRMEDGFCWSVVANTRPMNDNNGDALGDLMLTIRNVIHHWPDVDLF